MPAKNTVRQFAENCYYHVYNRGVEKRKVFLDKQDYVTFLYFLKKFLDPNLGSNPTSLSQEVDLLAFCLMPNHFHLQLKQLTNDGVTKLMRKLAVCYVSYFNSKYNRQGTLFQGKYKAAIILSDSYFLHVNRYIHRNPKRTNYQTYPYSSLSCYLGTTSISWVKKDEVLALFETDPNSYETFIDEYERDSKDVLEELTLDN